MVIAAVADATVLSYEKLAPSGAASRPAKPLAITPAFGPRKEGGFDVGIGGTF